MQLLERFCLKMSLFGRSNLFVKTYWELQMYWHFYAPAIRRIMERAYGGTTVCLSICLCLHLALAIWVSLWYPCPLDTITKTCLFKYTENFTTKKWKFSDKNSDIFHISAQNKNCGYSLEPPWRGSANEYPQSMFLSRNKKNKVYPCKPQLYYIKVGFKGVKII